MAFVDDMVALANELLGPGEDTFGEDVTISRPDAGAYDANTRRRTAGTPLEQVVRGTFESEVLTAAHIEGGLSTRHARVLYAAPRPTGGFEPRGADRVAGEGRTYQVTETAHIIKQNKPILWVCGLEVA